MERPSITTIALCSAAAIGLAVGVYFLSKDTERALDLKNKHTRENLLIILNEMHLEYTCIYTRYYNLILKMQDQKKWNDSLKSKIESDLKNDLKEKT
jgi:hypothetical protein